MTPANGIARRYCHRGLGSQLYCVHEEIAEKLGCEAVVMHTSGWTDRGDTRLDYMLRRGYEQYGRIEVIKRFP